MKPVSFWTTQSKHWFQQLIIQIVHESYLKLAHTNQTPKQSLNFLVARNIFTSFALKKFSEKINWNNPFQFFFHFQIKQTKRFPFHHWSHIKLQMETKFNFNFMIWWNPISTVKVVVFIPRKVFIWKIYQTMSNIWTTSLSATFKVSNLTWDALDLHLSTTVKKYSTIWENSRNITTLKRNSDSAMLIYGFERLVQHIPSMHSLDSSRALIFIVILPMYGFTPIQTNHHKLSWKAADSVIFIFILRGHIIYTDHGEWHGSHIYKYMEKHMKLSTRKNWIQSFERDQFNGVVTDTGTTMQYNKESKLIPVTTKFELSNKYWQGSLLAEDNAGKDFIMDFLPNQLPFVQISLPNGFHKKFVDSLEKINVSFIILVLFKYINWLELKYFY